jgi:hypothetical protein
MSLYTGALRILSSRRRRALWFSMGSRSAFQRGTYFDRVQYFAPAMRYIEQVVRDSGFTGPLAYHDLLTVVFMTQAARPRAGKYSIGLNGRPPGPDEASEVFVHDTQNVVGKILLLARQTALQAT